MLCKLIYRSDGKRVIFFKMNERERNLIKPTLLVQVHQGFLLVDYTECEFSCTDIYLI